MVNVDNDSVDVDDDFILDVVIGKNKMKMWVDSGAAVTAISRKSYEEKLQNNRLLPTNVRLRGYTGELIKPEGHFWADTTVSGVTKSIKYYVVNGGGPGLLGKDFIKAFQFKLSMKTPVMMAIFRV